MRLEPPLHIYCILQLALSALTILLENIRSTTHGANDPGVHDKVLHELLAKKQEVSLRRFLARDLS